MGNVGGTVGFLNENVPFRNVSFIAYHTWGFSITKLGRFEVQHKSCISRSNVGRI